MKRKPNTLSGEKKASPEKAATKPPRASSEMTATAKNPRLHNQTLAMKLMPQLAFNGQCRQAFEHYEKILGGKITVMNPFGEPNEADLPTGCTRPSPGQIRFAELQLGDFALLGNDVPAEAFEPMRGFSIALHTQGVADARRVFNALADGGRVTVPIEKVAWSPGFGMVTDRFGVPWLILALTP